MEFTFEEIQYIKQSIALVIEHKLGDKDDPKQVKLGEHLKERFLEAKNTLRP